MKKYLFLIIILLSSIAMEAHIGSPGVTMEGEAGPYPLTIVVNAPEVIPGTASVDIYLLNDHISEVQLKPIYWDIGEKGTPRADLAFPVPGKSGHYTGEIWLMSPGSAGIEVEITGDQGKGKILLPIMAVSTAQNEMDPSLGWTLAGLGLFLVILMVTIISISSGDSLVKPGEQVTTQVKRKRWIGAGAGLLILITILWGGESWWSTWETDYRKYMYKPLTATSSVSTQNNRQYLRFVVDSVRLELLRRTRDLHYLVPDHGKIMHMFLLRSGTLDVFAHLHPRRLETSSFETIIPPLPPGDYYVFTDVTRLSGFAETIADTVTIPAPDNELQNAWSDNQLMDEDDTYYITDPMVQSDEEVIMPGGDIVVCGSPGQRTMLPDNSWVTLEMPKERKFTSGNLYQLTFAFEDEQGNPSVLEPYLGMMGHAVVFKEDGSVYIHLHPVGSYSMASQEVLKNRFEEESGRINWGNLPGPKDFRDSIDREIAVLNAMPKNERESILSIGMDHQYEDPDHGEHAVVRFPYTFPKPGKYRIYVQMKRNQKILNGAFDVEVTM